jgi:hypothetical protein
MPDAMSVGDHLHQGVAARPLHHHDLDIANLGALALAGGEFVKRPRRKAGATAAMPMLDRTPGAKRYEMEPACSPLSGMTAKAGE